MVKPHGYMKRQPLFNNSVGPSFPGKFIPWYVGFDIILRHDGET